MLLKPGQQLSVESLLHGVITVSGNDAAVVLAEGITGTEAAFTQLMNAKAKQLGMRDSEFHTANGWPDSGRTLTTARDLAVLGTRTIHDFPELYRKYYGLGHYRWNNITQPNRNPLLGRVSGADEVKTGHTGQAGYCFTGTAEQNGRRIMMVVAGLGTTEARANESRRFLQWGFSAWRVQLLYNAQSVVATLPVQLGELSSIQAIAPRKLALALPARDAQRYKLFVRYTGPIKAPLKKGTQVAVLVAKFENGTERIMPLVAARSVAKAGYFGRLLNRFSYAAGHD
jgi:serine-type D-Ala-D-Ala carboxypeptidase (penicillin-binding protein 5/6)